MSVTTAYITALVNHRLVLQNESHRRQSSSVRICCHASDWQIRNAPLWLGLARGFSRNNLHQVAWVALPDTILAWYRRLIAPEVRWFEASDKVLRRHGISPASKRSENKVLEYDPRNCKAHDNAALCYAALQRDSDAPKHFMKALDLVHKEHPEHDWAYANLANFFWITINMKSLPACV